MTLFNNITKILGAVGAVGDIASNALYGIVNLITGVDLRLSEDSKKIILEKRQELVKSGEISYIEFLRLNNCEKIATKADEILQQKRQKTNHQNTKLDIDDFDWFVRFFEDCSLISNDFMQDIWANILAGKLENASGYSRRTLDVVKNLSQKEVSLFEQFLPFCLYRYDNVVFYNIGDDLCDKYGFDENLIRDLHECGLLSISDMQFTFDETMQQATLMWHNQDLIAIFHSDSPVMRKINLQMHRLTVPGKELISCVKNVAPNNDYFEYVCKDIANNHRATSMDSAKNGFTIDIKKYVKKTDGKYGYNSDISKTYPF